MSIWSQMAKDILERKAGRIFATGGGFVFEASPEQLRKTHRSNPSLVVSGKAIIVRADQDGREMVLVSQRTVTCPKKEGRQGIYPRGKSGWHYPEKLCKKCPHRKPADREYHWPRCMLMTADDPKKAATEELISCFNEAAKKTAEIMR
jgi:hypothetical protein